MVQLLLSRIKKDAVHAGLSPQLVLLKVLYYINNKQLVSFSEQQLVDCVTADFGCNGGLPSGMLFTYTAQNNGLATEQDYPYTATDGVCNEQSVAQVPVINKGYRDVAANSDALKAAIANNQSLVAVQAESILLPILWRWRYLEVNALQTLTTVYLLLVTMLSMESKLSSLRILGAEGWGNLWLRLYFN